MIIKPDQASGGEVESEGQSCFFPQTDGIAARGLVAPAALPDGVEPADGKAAQRPFASHRMVSAPAGG
jgi:hypothetical protein